MKKLFTLSWLTLTLNCSHQPTTPILFKTRTQWIMGTDISVTLAPSAAHLYPQVFDVFKDVDNKLSTYKANSEISRLNKIKQLEVSELSFRAIEVSLDLFKKTRGYFDPSLGKLTNAAYAFNRKNAKLPSDKEIKKALAEVGGENIKLTPPHLVTLRKHIELDFGGIGKGYAVDLAVQKLKDSSINQGQVAASGDIRCLSICDISVIDPFKPDQIMLVIKNLPPDSAISTSGTYERYIKDQKNHHLLDPKTGRPAQGFVSITLVGNISNTELDAWATALSVMPVEKAIAMAENLKDFGALFVLPDQRIIESSHFKKFAQYKDWKRKF